MQAGREEFLARIAAEFPDFVGELAPYSTGLLHCKGESIL